MPLTPEPYIFLMHRDSLEADNSLSEAECTSLCGPRSVLSSRSEGLPRTGYFIPVRDGVGVGDVGKFLRIHNNSSELA